MAEPDDDPPSAPPVPDPAATAAQPAVPPPPVRNRVCVIYCHGMGSQRRFEETSRLIDALDRYGRAYGAGRLSRIRAAPEPCRVSPGETVGFVKSTWSERDDATGTWGNYKEVRFYEIYWAPIMAGQKSAWRVLRWIAAQVLRPWRTVGSPWRERQRLRRAALAGMFEPGRPLPRGAEPWDFGKLVAAYDSYEGLDAQRASRFGDFKGFLDEIARLYDKKPDTRRRLQRLARAWRWRYLMEEARNAFVLTTMALSGVLVFVGVVALVLLVIRWMGGNTAVSAVLTPLVGPLLGSDGKPDGKTALSLAVGLFGLLGIGRFLTDAMGDVEAWTTYRETDEKHDSREKIKAEAIKIMRHVLGDEKCERVAIISHSLGTTIANDSLLSLAQANRAVNLRDPIIGPPDLRLIEHFVTMGSPIDKVEYFFESYSSQSHRYKRVTEAMRGDIGTEPFSRMRKPNLHWINFWDTGDLVSGALQSPLHRSRVNARVDNVHVRNRRFPDPGASHLDYIANRRVVGALFEMIYRRDASYRALASVPGNGKDYASVALGPGGTPPASQRFFQLLAVLVPWTALAGAVAAMFCRIEPWIAAAPATLLGVVLILFYLLDRWRQPVDPIPIVADPMEGKDEEA